MILRTGHLPILIVKVFPYFLVPGPGDFAVVDADAQIMSQGRTRLDGMSSAELCPIDGVAGLLYCPDELVAHGKARPRGLVAGSRGVLFCLVRASVLVA